MNKRLSFLSIALLLAVPALADNVPAAAALDSLAKMPKLEFVHLSNIAEKSTLGEKTKKSIEDKHKAIVQELQAANTDFEKLAAETSAKLPAMKDQTARNNAEKELMTKKRNLEGLAQDREAELKQFYVAQSEVVIKETVDAVTAHARTKGVDVVFDIDSGKPVYVADNVDFTTEYLKAVESNYNNKLNVAKNSKLPSLKAPGKLS